MSEENSSQNPNIPPSENADSASEIQKLQEQAEKFKNDFLYLRAEFENYKRNAIKERSEMTKYGGERLVRDLLEVVDNFERALNINVTAENFATFKQGVDMTAQELRSLLQRHNVTEVPAHGAPFDPAVHEALSAEVTDQMPPGHVVRVFKKPYKLHDKVIRPGQVVVAKKPE
ncbi:nucleotide exchange factor GrpE [Bdellovibrio bacteriovorus]|uniref:nucleotide exchange factor GrpE n=1 Tax=Bdellovibrio bacteriovorus TaxID=959 RepID=UPI0021CF31C4|nr:nucleotide exchange factor GrpE [Bdellovibrio bacteriovorus]UXR65780.1 nucleotide exchange factor GrpE [Bdellovibrio bacteriovorus]